MDDDESKIAEKYEALRSVMDEQNAPIVGSYRSACTRLRRCQHRLVGGRPDASDDHGGDEGAG